MRDYHEWFIRGHSFQQDVKIALQGPHRRWFLVSSGVQNRASDECWQEADSKVAGRRAWGCLMISGNGSGLPCCTPFLLSLTTLIWTVQNRSCAWAGVGIVPWFHVVCLGWECIQWFMRCISHVFLQNRHYLQNPKKIVVPVHDLFMILDVWM